MSVVPEDAETALPDGWELQPLAEACDPVSTRKPEDEPDRQFRYIDISSINRETLSIESPQTLLGREAPSRARQIVQTGDVLFSTVRPNLRTVAVVPAELDGQIASTGFCVLRPRSVSPRFLFRAVTADAFVDRVVAKARGISYPAVRANDILEERIPVPPSEEQARIVSTLDELMERLAEGVALVKGAEAGISVFRTSVLSSAVSGRLAIDASDDGDDGDASSLLSRVLETRAEAWRNAGMSRYAEPVPAAKPDSRLPAGWTWASIDQLAIGVQYGSSAKAGSDVEGVPVLRMGNLVNGRINASDLKYLRHDHEEFPALLLRDGDLLFNRTNSPELVGKTAVFRGLPGQWSFASYLIRVRFATGVVPEYVSHYLNSAYGRRWVSESVSQQVGQANVNGTKLRGLTIPLPPTQTQRAIVHAVEQALSASEALGTTLRCALADRRHLERSLLQNALRGGLLARVVSSGRPKNGNNGRGAVLVAE